MTTASPGWYQHETLMRYWDGMDWTDQTRPLVQQTAVPATTESAGGIVTVGYILAVLMPLIGFILGIVVATRPVKTTSKHGAWIIVVSVGAFIVWIAILAQGASTATPTY